MNHSYQKDRPCVACGDIEGCHNSGILVLDHGYVRYIDHMGSDQRVVEAARALSYEDSRKGKL